MKEHKECKKCVAVATAAAVQGQRGHFRCSEHGGGDVGPLYWISLRPAQGQADITPFDPSRDGWDREGYPASAARATEIARNIVNGPWSHSTTWELIYNLAGREWPVRSRP